MFTFNHKNNDYLSGFHKNMIFVKKKKKKQHSVKGKLIYSCLHIEMLDSENKIKKNTSYSVCNVCVYMCTCSCGIASVLSHSIYGLPIISRVLMN